MTRHNKRKLHEVRKVAMGGSPDTILDTLLALDRAVVELSMHMYRLPLRDRFAMREENQRLHDAVRQHLR